jgi:hypothetical protein
MKERIKCACCVFRVSGRSWQHLRGVSGIPNNSLPFDSFVSCSSDSSQMSALEGCGYGFLSDPKGL